MNGQGTLTSPDCTEYVGEFRDGQMTGVGKTTYPDGKAKDGLWKDDKFLGAVQ
jgi:hypothetical protein